MTTFAFVPSSTSPFSFQPTFDGATYNVTVTWNIFGLRYYLNCSDMSGNPIFTLPLIGSPITDDISITAGYFDSTLVYNSDTQIFTVTP